MSLIHKTIYQFILITSLLMSGHALAQMQDDEPLMPEKAFPAEVVSVNNETISIRWQVADKYYLYRSKFRFSEDQDSIELGEPESPPGKVKHDEFFGDVETYRGSVTVKLPYTAAAGAPASFTLTATSQGCADLGICYPPHKQKLQIKLPAGKSKAATKLPNPIAALSNLGKSLGLGGGADEEFLEPDQAFQLLTTQEKDGAIRLEFTAAESYYLYRDKIKVKLADPTGKVQLGTLELPEGKVKHDEYFGDVTVYYNGATGRVPVINSGKQTLPFKLMVQYQGCADAGLCYPPQNKIFNFNAIPTASAGSPAPTQTATDTPEQTEPEQVNKLSTGEIIAAILTAFGVGFLLTFTPCVLPMIPILSSIIIGQSDEKPSPRRAGALSLVYVMGTAVTYTAVGVLAGATGDQLQAYFQNPWVIGTFVIVLFGMALSMFGLYEIQMPSFIQSRMQSKTHAQKGGTYAGVFIMGLLSAAIVGACVSPGLIAVLGIAMQTQDPVLGGAIMFSMAMGMGIVLVMIGFGLGMAPKAGAWMDTVKYVFGVMLLAVAIYLLSLIPDVPVLYLWATLFIVTGVYMNATQALPEGASGWQYLWKGFGMLLLVWGVFALLGGFAGNRDIMKPIEFNQFSGQPGGTVMQVSHEEMFTKINTVDEFEAQLKLAIQQGKPVMVDFYADWCTDCLRMEKGTFSNPEVQDLLSNKFIALQIDVTENDEIDRQIKKHLNIFGPPAILFFSPQGKPLKKLNFYGYMKADEFIPHIKQVLAR